MFGHWQFTSRLAKPRRASPTHAVLIPRCARRALPRLSVPLWASGRLWTPLSAAPCLVVPWRASPCPLIPRRALQCLAVSLYPRPILDGSLWKREPWFSPARKASWNDDCGRPAVSESFGIPKRIWIPPAPIFAVLGFLFFLEFSLTRSLVIEFPQVRQID